ncbi:hypothetical protein BDF20DRAFT_852726 [Mycotypha africana]|uniref:uncharacterized protein n=1 Tax=Mycotypha africana TaxID=64632 RepID=UPI0022FFE9D4|nr:uncharacterized protein BDF20DRAFT_852726 [Mycotypha africana]KAI8987895.1 hypothetical protein BDF20DRAFT_852726 [Mycotypha africana]
MNYYIIKNRNLTVQEYIYEQNFWYCISYINHTVALTFDDVATDDPSIISPFKDQKIKGYSDAMTAACESIATTYMNHMVENFTKRIRYYLYWALKPTFQETKNNVIYGLIDSYCLPKILNDMDTCKWLEDVDITKQPEVDATCQSLMKKMPSTPTIENITAAPSTFLPPLAFMLQLIETKALTAGPNDKKPKLFSLTPTVSFKWKHVSINEKALCCLSRQSIGNGSYANNLEIFFNVFNFAKFGYETLQDLVRAPANSKDMFNCVIHTDGFAVTFLFVRSRQEKSATATLTLEDYTPAEINKYFMPIAVDPGRNEIFTAVVGYNTDMHQIRACSKEERAQIAGYNRRARVVDEKKVATGIKEIETNLPTCKTVHSEIQYKLYLSYVLRHIQSLHEFYGFNSAKFIFNDYQGRQRADEELANMLLDGGKKYNPRKRKKTNKNKRRKRKLPRGSKTAKSKVHARKAQRAAERKEGQEKKLTINVEAAVQKRYAFITTDSTVTGNYINTLTCPLQIQNKDC